LPARRGVIRVSIASEVLGEVLAEERAAVERRLAELKLDLTNRLASPGVDPVDLPIFLRVPVDR
jgi:hypothetical protein